MKITKEVYFNGVVEYKNERGELHREDGPAWISPDGYKEYWLNGKLHRVDGPALIWSNGDEFYYLNNNRYTHKEWLKQIPNPISIKWREFCESK